MKVFTVMKQVGKMTVSLRGWHAVLLLAVLTLTGCRQMESEDPPVHLNLNMDFQERFDPQEPNAFFADGRAMRPPAQGTVARGMLREDTRFFSGEEQSGELVGRIPVPVTMELVKRGQNRFDIYCAVCHGLDGDGQGIIMTGGYGYTPAPSYHIDRLREVPDGYIYNVITNGVRTMPSYAQQVPVADRWAIVAYIRALQKGQNATRADVPPQILPTLVAPVVDSTATTPAAGDSTQAAPADTASTPE